MLSREAAPAGSRVSIYAARPTIILAPTECLPVAAAPGREAIGACQNDVNMIQFTQNCVIDSISLLPNPGIHSATKLP